MNNCLYTALAVRFSDRLAGISTRAQITDWDARQIRISGDSSSHERFSGLSWKHKEEQNKREGKQP